MEIHNVEKKIAEHVLYASNKAGKIAKKHEKRRIRRVSETRRHLKRNPNDYVAMRLLRKTLRRIEEKNLQ